MAIGQTFIHLAGKHVRVLLIFKDYITISALQMMVWTTTGALQQCSFSFSLDRYSIEQSEGSKGYFDIEPISGIIRTTHLLDREDVAWHNITVMAKEDGGYHI